MSAKKLDETKAAKITVRSRSATSSASAASAASKTSAAAKSTASEPAKSQLAGRDIVYIDTDDDITAIIEKVKNAEAPVVALVPPVRVGVLQSVVNLKLLLMAAKSARKKISLVTNERALIGLAAGLKIPVAKTINAQAEIPVLDSDDGDSEDSDVIRGEELAIGDLAALTSEPSKRNDTKEDKEVSAAVASIETDDKIKTTARDIDEETGEETDKPQKKPARGKKIPNFSSFRKKLFLFGGLGVVVIIFFVWAIVFAPHGTITVKANTISRDISVAATVTSGKTEGSNLNAVIKQTKTNETLNFNATGSKEIGNKATGTITISVSLTQIHPVRGLTVEAGTTVVASDGGQRYVTDDDAPFPASLRNGSATISEYVQYCGSMASTTCYYSVDATAANVGSNYNILTGANMTVSGGYSAVVKEDFTGGSSQTVTVVQQSDIDLATEKLKNQINDKVEQTKSDLISQMSGDATAIADSFSVAYGDFTSKPALDDTPTAGASASMSVEVTYTLVGVANSDLSAMLDAELTAQMANETNQRVYDNGLKAVKFARFEATDNGYSVTISTSGKVGPRLDEEQIKELALGKRVGEIREALTRINGVDSVEVKFSPFWVSSISDAKKLTVDFAVN
jgi:hypothetical protein